MIKTFTKLSLVLTTALLCLTGCSDDEKFAPLELEKNEINMAVDEVAEVKIVSGNGEYRINVQEAAIAKAELKGTAVIAIMAIDTGKTVIKVEDVRAKQVKEISVDVTIPYREITMNRLVEIFKKDADQANVEFGKSLCKTESLPYSMQSKFRVSVEGVKMNLYQERIGNANVDFKLWPGNVDRQETFKKFIPLVNAIPEAEFYLASIAKYDAQGMMPSATQKNYSTLAAFEAAMSSIDWNADFVTVGYKIGDGMSVELRCDKGVESIVLRPKNTHDTYKWYQRFLGQDFNRTLLDLYYQVSSTGIIPPAEQLFMLPGVDRRGNLFNAVFFAKVSSPIERIEISYQSTKDNADKVKAAWLSLVENNDVVDNFGTFQEAFVFPLQGSGLIRLGTLQETIDFVKEREINSYATLIPIFNTKERNVISPQITDGNLIVVIGKLDAAPN